MKYFFVNLELTDGEHSYTVHKVFAVPAEEDLNHAIVGYLLDYFGGDTKQDRSNRLLFWDRGDVRCIKVSSTKEIPKEDYDVLTRYL